MKLRTLFKSKVFFIGSLLVLGVTVGGVMLTRPDVPDVDEPLLDEVEVKAWVWTNLTRFIEDNYTGERYPKDVFNEQTIETGYLGEHKWCVTISGRYTEETVNSVGYESRRRSEFYPVPKDEEMKGLSPLDKWSLKYGLIRVLKIQITTITTYLKLTIYFDEHDYTQYKTVEVEQQVITVIDKYIP